MVTALDMPPVDAIIVESVKPNGPFGAKEVGEGAIMPTIPAVLTPSTMPPGSGSSSFP